MAKPDDFTITLLHRIQGARLSPEGGWLTLQELRSLMALNQQESQHLHAPLAELLEAGMIEKTFRNGRDEWRSRGVQPAMGHSNDEFADAVKYLAPKVDAALTRQARSREEAARDLMQEAIEEVDRRVPAIFTVILPAGRQGRVRHAAFLMGEYPEPIWWTQCGLKVPAEKMTEIREQLVTCTACNDNLLRTSTVRAKMQARR